MPTRPSIHSLPDSTSSALHHYPTPVHHLYPLFAGLIFHVIPAKLEDDLTKIYECVDALGGKCDGLEGAKIVVTGLRGRARLVRAIGKDWVVRHISWVQCS
jgi:DNA polymerase mu